MTTGRLTIAAHRLRRGPVACVLLALVALLAACQSPTNRDEQAQEPVAPSFEPIVFPNPRARAGEGGVLRERRPVDEAEAGWEEKWGLASQYVAGGYDDAAMQIIAAALAQKPPEPWASRLRGLRSSLRMRRATQDLLRVEVRPARDYVEFGRDVDITLRVRNVSNQEIVFLPPQRTAGGGTSVSPSAVALEIVRRDRDVHASELRRTWTQTVYLQRVDGQRIRIRPGGMFEMKARIPAADVGPSISGLRILEVGGTLRPTRVHVAGEERALRVPVRACRVIVVPKGFEPLAVDPLGSMRTAIDTAAPVHLLVATEFVPRSKRVEAVEILADALIRGDASLQRAAVGGLHTIRDHSAGEPMAPLAAPLMEALDRTLDRTEPVMFGLGVVTGANIPPDPRLWREWWRREADAHTPVPAAGG